MGRPRQGKGGGGKGGGAWKEKERAERDKSVTGYVASYSCAASPRPALPISHDTGW